MRSRKASEELDWARFTGEGGTYWCRLTELEPLSITDADLTGQGPGVYVVWHGGGWPDESVVCVGSASLLLPALHRLQADQELLQFKDRGLYITWAAVRGSQRAGIERFLAETLDPALPGQTPSVVPVAANLPWEVAPHFSIGEKPGEGCYECATCPDWTVQLDDADDRLPPCGNCGEGQHVLYRRTWGGGSDVRLL